MKKDIKKLIKSHRRRELKTIKEIRDKLKKSKDLVIDDIVVNPRISIKTASKFIKETDSITIISIEPYFLIDNDEWVKISYIKKLKY